MYGAVQAIGNLDMDIIDRHQAVKGRLLKLYRNVMSCSTQQERELKMVLKSLANLHGK